MEKSFKAGDVVVLRNGTIVDDLIYDPYESRYPLSSSSLVECWTRSGNFCSSKEEDELDIVDYATYSKGGSSDYYKIPEGTKTLSELVEKKNIAFPYNVLFLHLFRSLNGMLLSDCKEFKDIVRKAENATRDYKYPLFDHDHFNITKAIYRFGNKDGTSTEYDLNKIKFFLDDLLKHNYDPILAEIRKEL